MRKELEMCNLLKIYAFLVFCLIASPAYLKAEEARITDAFVSVRNEELLIVAKLQGCFTPKIDSAILAGIPTSFTFIAEIYEERPFWFDRRLMTISEVKTIKYDLLKKMFYLNTGDFKEPLVLNDFEAAKKAMSEYSIAVQVKDILKKPNHGPYYVKMKAKLDRIKLPLRLELILVFVSLWDFETAWYRYPINF